MGVNQFAKISPVVNSMGELLEKNESGKYTKTTITLKENETGICIDDNSILVMFKGKPVKLSGGLYENRESALSYVNNNNSGQYNGQLVVIKDEPDKLYVIIGKQLYNLTENGTKTIFIKIPESVDDNTPIKYIVENSVMQNEYSKEYLINTIDVKFPGEQDSYQFIRSAQDPDNIKYPKIEIVGDKKGSINIDVTDSFYNNNTRFIVNDTFKGKLNISLKVSEFNENYSGDIINSYKCNTSDDIILVITYTILN